MPKVWIDPNESWVRGWEAVEPIKPTKGVSGSPAEAGPLYRPDLTTGTQPQQRHFSATEVHNENERRINDEDSFFASVGAAVQGTFAASAKDLLVDTFQNLQVAADNGYRIPSYRAPDEYFENLTEAEYEIMERAANEEHAKALKKRIEDRRLGDALLGRAGGFGALGYGLIAGLPEGMLTGGLGSLAGAKLMRQVALDKGVTAQQGARATVLGQYGGEFAGSTALNVGQEIIDPYTGLSDVALGAVLDGLSSIGVKSALKQVDSLYKIQAQDPRVDNTPAPPNPVLPPREDIQVPPPVKPAEEVAESAPLPEAPRKAPPPEEAPAYPEDVQYLVDQAKEVQSRLNQATDTDTRWDLTREVQYLRQRVADLGHKNAIPAPLHPSNPSKTIDDVDDLRKLQYEEYLMTLPTERYFTQTSPEAQADIARRPHGILAAQHNLHRRDGVTVWFDKGVTPGKDWEPVPWNDTSYGPVYRYDPKTNSAELFGQEAHVDADLPPGLKKQTEVITSDQQKFVNTAELPDYSGTLWDQLVRPVREGSRESNYEGVRTSGAVPQAWVDVAARISKAFLPEGHTLHIHAGKLPGNPSAKGVASILYNKEAILVVDPSLSRHQQYYTLLHELGHIVVPHILESNRVSPELKAAFLKYARDTNGLLRARGGKEGALAAAVRRWGAAPHAPWGKVKGMKEALVQMSITDLFKTSYEELKKQTRARKWGPSEGYHDALDEIFADIFANEMIRRSPDTFKDSPALLGQVKEWVTRLMKDFREVLEKLGVPPADHPKAVRDFFVQAAKPVQESLVASHALAPEPEVPLTAASTFAQKTAETQEWMDQGLGARYTFTSHYAKAFGVPVSVLDHAWNSMQPSTKPGVWASAAIPQWMVDQLDYINKNFLQDGHEFRITDQALPPDSFGVVAPVGRNVTVIGVSDTGPQSLNILLHEIGHKVMIAALENPDVPAHVKSAYRKWASDLQKKLALPAGKAGKEAFLTRMNNGLVNVLNNLRTKFKVEEESVLADLDTLSAREVIEKAAGKQPDPDYWVNLDEISAQQFGEAVRKELEKEFGKKLKFPEEVVLFFKGTARRMTGFAKALGIKQFKTPKEVSDLVAAQRRPEVPVSKSEGPETNAIPEAKDRKAERYQPSELGQRYGVDTLPQGSDGEVATAILVDRIVQEAILNPPPPIRKEATSRLLMHDKWKDNTIANEAISAGQIAARSKNPVARWVAHNIGESASNITGGRKVTAAIERFRMERHVMGNALWEIDSAYNQWARAGGRGLFRRYLRGDTKREWDSVLQRRQQEIRKWVMKPDNTKKEYDGYNMADPVDRALYQIAKAHDRANKLEQQYRVAGTRNEYINPHGYMTRSLDPTKVAELSLDQYRSLTDAFYKRFVIDLGWAPEVARRVAERYLDRARKARGGLFKPHSMNLDNEGAIRVIQDVLREEKYTDAEIEKLTGPLLGTAEGHFGSKLNIPEDEDLGGGITLGDLLWNDQTSMIRDRARAAAGWSALAQAGVHGYTGMDAIIQAVVLGTGESQATKAEITAVKQILAEVSSVPLEGVPYSVAMNTLASATSTIRLGGLMWNAVPEVLNAASQVGWASFVKGIPQAKRIHDDIQHILKTGKPRPGGVLSELEGAFGTTFGTDGYFLASPWDTNGKLRDFQGSEDESQLARAFGAVGHIQTVVSGFRKVVGVQQRLSAELVVQQILGDLKTKGVDAMLKDPRITDIGFNERHLRHLASRLDDIAAFDANGKATYFAAGKLDPEFVSEFHANVTRAVNQMIQGTFAGERGHYVHNSFLRILTQFRGYSITALEKQVSRQIANQGYARAALLLGTAMLPAMAVVAARTYASSVGREDQEEYLKRNLTLSELLQRSLNYVALSGLSSDILDAFQDLTGQNPTNQSFIGGRWVPAIGIINDLYKAPTDPKRLLDLVPLAKLPFMVPASNFLKDAVTPDTDE